MAHSIVNRRSSQNLLFGERKKVLVSAVGGEVFVSGSYKYHVFKSTDTFNVIWKSNENITLDYAVVGGGETGGAGSGTTGAGGNGGSGRYSQGYNYNFNNFNVGTNYVVTIGGAGSHSTITTNSTTITSQVANNGGGGGLGYSSAPACVDEDCDPPSCTCPSNTFNCEDNCCEHTCDGNCVTGFLCRADCSPEQYDYCNNNPCDCYPSACGETCTCTVEEDCTPGECNCVCVQCVGGVNTDGGSGFGGVDDALITQFGPQGPSYNIPYGHGGGGGGGGGGSPTSLGGFPNGGDGGSPAENGTDAEANTGIGGGGGGGSADNATVCVNLTACTAELQGSQSGTNSAGFGGLGSSGIVFIRYKFQE